jgi:hypothetical protein
MSRFTVFPAALPCGIRFARRGPQVSWAQPRQTENADRLVAEDHSKRYVGKSFRGNIGVDWEYRKIYLNDHPRRGNDIELLCEAGEAGWELVAIAPHNVAYLKRAVERAPTLRTKNHATSNVHWKYRNPATAETWSGRGRMPSWLKHKQDAGEDIKSYRVRA